MEWNVRICYLKKYNNTIHSSTKHTPLEAHKDKNASDVVINLALNANYKRKYNTINIGDDVNIFTKIQVIIRHAKKRQADGVQTLIK